MSTNRTIPTPAWANKVAKEVLGQHGLTGRDIRIYFQTGGGNTLGQYSHIGRKIKIFRSGDPSSYEIGVLLHELSHAIVRYRHGTHCRRVKEQSHTKEFWDICCDLTEQYGGKYLLALASVTTGYKRGQKAMQKRAGQKFSLDLLIKLWYDRG